MLETNTAAVNLDGYVLRRLVHEDLQAVHDVHRSVISTLPTADLFRDVSLEFLEVLLGDGAATFGIFQHDDLVAYSAVRFPKAGELKLASIVGVPNALAEMVAEFEGVAVLPAHRGRGFQAALTEIRAKAALLDGRPIAIASVAPQNLHSLRNFLLYGMTGRALVEMYGGYRRIVVVRDHGASASTSERENLIVDAREVENLKDKMSVGYEIVDVIGAQRVDAYVISRRSRERAYSDGSRASEMDGYLISLRPERPGTPAL